MTIDTLKVAKRLKEAGFNDLQAEAVVATVQESAEGADLATKSDLREVEAALRMEIAGVRAEMREMELRLEAKMEAPNSQILNRVFGMILSAIVINVVVIVGAIFGVAKLAGH